MEKFEINCFLEGEEGSFAVDINDAMAVNTLQQAIKEVKPQTLGTIEPNTLVLYKVNFDEDEETTIKRAFEAIAKKESHLTKLRASHKLSKYFGAPNRPEEGKVHVLVVRPERECSFRKPVHRPSSLKLPVLTQPPARRGPSNDSLVHSSCRVVLSPLAVPCQPNWRCTSHAAVSVSKLQRRPPYAFPSTPCTLQRLPCCPILHSLCQQ